MPKSEQPQREGFGAEAAQMSERERTAWKAYAGLNDAMQQAVTFDQQNFGVHASGSCIKHLKVGNNAAMADQAALVHLLITTGVITREAYAEACMLLMANEVQMYTDRISRKLGRPITFTGVTPT